MKGNGIVSSRIIFALCRTVRIFIHSENTVISLITSVSYTPPSRLRKQIPIILVIDYNWNHIESLRCNCHIMIPQGLTSHKAGYQK